MIIALRLSDGLLTSIRCALPRNTEVTRVAHAKDVGDQPYFRQGAVMLATLPDAGDAELAGQLETVRKSYPWIPLVLLAVTREGVALPMAIRAGELGIAALIDLSARDWREQLHRAVTSGARLALSQIVWEKAELTLPDPAVTLFKKALKLAHVPFSVGELAAACGVPERALRKHCEREGFPAPQWIVGWSRLLLASYLLTHSSATASELARNLEFGTARDLHGMMRRYLRGMKGSRHLSDNAFVTVGAAVERVFSQPSTHLSVRAARTTAMHGHATQ